MGIHSFLLKLPTAFARGFVSTTFIYQLITVTSSIALTDVDSGIRPSEITVLSFVGRDRSVAGQDLVRLKNGIRLKHINEADLSGVSGVDITVNYASIYEYKGLDNEVILLTDVNDLDRNMVSSALHLVGATRARNHYIMYVTPDVMTRLLDPNEGNLLHSIDPSYIN